MSYICINPNMSISEALPRGRGGTQRLVPLAPFEYKFVDQDYPLKFDAEERVGKPAYLFVVLAIGISCLGLFGLPSLAAEQRTREIGVRKVLGASVVTV